MCNQDINVISGLNPISALSLTSDYFSSVNIVEVSIS